MTIEELVRLLGRRLHRRTLCFSDEGTCRLRINKKLVVDIQKGENSTTIFLYAIVGKIAKDQDWRLYQLLLEANLATNRMAGTSFGIDSEEKEILLYSQIETQNIEFQWFFARFETFVDTAHQWMKRLEQSSKELP